MLIPIVFILHIIMYFVPSLCRELCECRRYPWPVYTYLPFTSCVSTLATSYVSTSWVCRNFFRVVSFRFPHFCDLMLFNWTSSIQVYPSSFSLISYPHVISGVIIFWTNILLFFLCYLCWFLYQKSISVFGYYMDSSSSWYSVSLPWRWCAFLMVYIGHKGFFCRFRWIFMSLLSNF